MTTSERQTREQRIARLEADIARIGEERDRYREEASKLRTVCHHMLEAARHRNAAAMLDAQAQGAMREAMALMLAWDPDRVA